MEINISREELGDAIVEAVYWQLGMGRPNPYRVMATSFKLQKKGELLATFSGGSRKEDWDNWTVRPGAPRHLDESLLIVVKREVVFARLGVLIDIEHFMQSPCIDVLNIAPDIPERFHVRLRFVPMGALISEAEPIFDGSLPPPD